MLGSIFTVKSLATRLVPNGVKQWVRRIATSLIDQNSIAAGPPRMIYGYTNKGGDHKKKTRISSSAFLYYPERILIEDNVFIWHYTILDGTGTLEIGEGTQIGAWVGIFTHSSHISIRIYGSHYQEVHETEKAGYLIRSVRIGRYVFIGAGAKILPGVTIGDGALISAGSLVKESVPPFAIVEGTPGKIVGDTTRLDKRYLRDPQLREWYFEWAPNINSSGADTRHE